MNIVFCAPEEAPRIAYEEVEGSHEGDFFLDEGGVVRFSHPADGHVWFAAPDPQAFRLAVEMWNAFRQAGSLPGQEARLAAVENLRQGLSRLGLLPDRPEALWSVLLEQAEAGLF
jgi:hypothetical protein